MAEDYMGVPGLTAAGAMSMTEQTEGLPKIITGLDRPKPRGKSGMSLEKEQAIAARKLEEQGGSNKKVVNTFTNSKGQQIAVFDDGTTTVIGMAEDQIGERKSAFDILKEEFTRYGLGDLVGDTQALAVEGISPAEFSLKLRQTVPYKNRFKANEARIGAGLSSLSEAEYIALEDQYQNIMRQYGLPASFYAKDGQGKQANLEKFIAGDVSPAELENRVQLAINRVDKAAPEVIKALETYYGGPGGISKSNLVGYVLDPQRALPEIQRKIQAAEIGGAAQTAGFGIGALRAEELAARGITQAQAQQGYQTAAEILPRATQLADIYGAEKYDQTAAEQEIFGLEGAASARRKRQRLTGMEQAQFGAQTGMGASALERGRSGAF